MKISRLGEAPDYRFSLANERTFLAWIRTALGFLAAGVGLDQLAPDFATPLIREVLALVAIVLWRYTRSRNLMDVAQDDFVQPKAVRDKFLIALAVLSLSLLFAVTHIQQIVHL